MGPGWGGGQSPRGQEGHMRGFSLDPSCPQEGVPRPWLRAGLCRAPAVRTPHSGGGGLVLSEQGFQGDPEKGVPRDTKRGACGTAPGEMPVGSSRGRESWGREGHSLERVHAKGHVHAGAVGQEGSEGRLLKQAEDQDLVPGGTGRAGPSNPDPPTDTGPAKADREAGTGTQGARAA